MVQIRNVFTCSFVYFMTLTCATCDYWEDRENFIQKERNHLLGASLILNSDEILANHILMSYKYKEYDEGFLHPEQFLPSQHFFNSKYAIEQSEVFKIIKALPKGASLHGHDTSLASFESFVKLTHEPNLYACLEDGKVHLKFFRPDKLDNLTCTWELLETLRKNASTNIDEKIAQQASLVVDNPHEMYSDVNKAWKAFSNIFEVVTPMLTYKPIWKKYFYEALRELYEDNVMYIEFRSTLPTLYDLDGNLYGPLEVVKAYKETVHEFKKHYPDFHGAKLIYAPQRKVDNTTMKKYIKTASLLKSTYPEFVAGFDLVGQEDLGEPLFKFIGEIQELQTIHMKFFFHAGETNWFGTNTDLNLVDAVLLNTTRIGHGYALSKHPEVLKQIKLRGIGIEVNPISNQVLALVDDMRNHPASYFVANGYPVVMCNDDPGFWGAKGLSYDWYMAFMGIAGREADLRFLKQLALNSYKYSALTLENKIDKIHSWEIRWNNFIQNLLLLNKTSGYEVVHQQ